MYLMSYNVHSPTSPPCSDELQTIEYNTNRKSSWTVHILYPPHDGGIVHANVYQSGKTAKRGIPQTRYLSRN